MAPPSDNRDASMSGLVTLTTDFGSVDGYAGAVKGVLLAACRELRVIDITHDLPMGDVLAGALALEAAINWFPPATVHLAVVDPGVGSDRNALLLQDEHGSFALGPDNGLLSLAFGEPVACWKLDVGRVSSRPVSPVFHGRDLFAPAAAALVAGADAGDLGDPVGDFERLQLPVPKSVGGQLEGEVIHVDRFGNMVTNIAASLATGLPGTGELKTAAGGLVIDGFSRCYADVGEGELLALEGSGGRLELALRAGSAAELPAMSGVGMPLRVYRSE
ncbi:MAG TPA: hypothetical protein EYG16_00085 [Deltaproteobacteria bacterium]|nr:hypothetical protein [Candidatus Binatota bacterium]HIL12054.1 hypothetical protein [Deltaproteobacteria bacterium]